MSENINKNKETEITKNYLGIDPLLDEGIGSFGERLKKEIENSPHSNRQLAKAAGVSETAIRNYTKGRMPQIDVAHTLAKALNVNYSYLVYGLQDKVPEIESQVSDTTVTYNPGYDFLEEFALIAGYHVSVSTGHGSINSDAPVKRHLAFRRKWLEYRKLNETELVVVFAKGESMEPTIHNNNTILVDTSDKDLKDSSIYVLRFGDELYAKRLQKRFDGSIELISDNKEYKDQIVRPDELDQLAIIGKVVWIGKDLY